MIGPGSDKKETLENITSLKQGLSPIWSSRGPARRPWPGWVPRTKKTRPGRLQERDRGVPEKAGAEKVSRGGKKVPRQLFQLTLSILTLKVRVFYVLIFHLCLGDYLLSLQIWPLQLLLVSEHHQWPFLGLLTHDSRLSSTGSYLTNPLSLSIADSFSLIHSLSLSSTSSLTNLVSPIQVHKFTSN